jgi:hypothetical protein
VNAAGTHIIQLAECYTAQWFDESGKRRKAPTGCHDKATAQQVADKLQLETALRRRGIIDPAAERFAREARRPVAEHVAEYEASLTARGRETRYVAETCGRLRRVLDLCGTAGIRDLAPATVESALQSIRDAGAGLETLNSYLRSVKSFCRWLWLEKRTPAPHPT